MLVDELELEAWLREAGFSGIGSPEEAGRRQPAHSHSRNHFRTTAVVMNGSRPRLQLVPHELIGAGAEECQ